MRIGTGYDIHRLVEGRQLVLGGVHIPHSKGLLGHSDADVLSHAIADAMLGAAGLGDIGYYFPNNDPEIEGIDSQIILKKTVEEIAKHGLKPHNVDAALIAEEPKIGPHLDAMKEKLSESLGIAPGSIGIKATTNEGIGDLGKGAGIAAHAVCLLVEI
jgi:2-C-methyl-D-erythritol 2,4-cyclodiphosphate synthase